MEYKYKDISFNKRPLTEDIALVVVSKETTTAGSVDFIQKTFPFKAGETAAQADSCPVRKIEWLHELVGYVKTQIDGFRIRNAQLSGIIALDGIFSVDGETAEFMAAAGSTSVIAQGYTEEARKILQENDIFPFISDEHFDVNDFILVRGIKNGLKNNSFKSYRIHSDSMERVDIRL